MRREQLTEKRRVGADKDRRLPDFYLLDFSFSWKVLTVPCPMGKAFYHLSVDLPTFFLFGRIRRRKKWSGQGGRSEEAESQR